MLNYRENVLFIDSSGPSFAGSYTVTAYPVGAVATSASSGATLTVAAGHSFVANDKILIDPGGDKTFSGVNVVSSVTATSIVMDGGTYAVSVGDKIVNLGPDTGTTSPNYDASPMGIYTDPAGSTAASNATVTASSAGEYSYWHRGDGQFWELVRDSSGTLQDVIAGFGRIAGRYNVCDFGCKGDGSTDDSTRIQGVINQVEGASGSKVYLPGGSYQIDSGLTVDNSFVEIEGDGPEDSIVYTTIAAGNALSVDLSSVTNPRDKMFAMRRVGFYQKTNALTSGSIIVNIGGAGVVERAILDEVTIRGDESSDLVSSGTALNLGDINMCDLYSLHITGRDAAKFDVGVDIGNGVSSNRGNVTFIGGRIFRCETAHVRIASGASNRVNNIQMLGTKIKGTTNAGTTETGVEVLGQGSGIVIKGCHIESVGFPVILNGCDTVAIEETNFARYDETGSATRAAIGCESAAVTGLRVSGCRISNNSSGGYAFSFSAHAHEQVELVNNNFNNVDTVISDSSTGVLFRFDSVGSSGKRHWYKRGDVTIDEFLRLGPGTTLTVTTNAITVTGSYHVIDTSSSPQTVNTITLSSATQSSSSGHVLVLGTNSASNSATLSDGTNLKLAGDFVMNSNQDRILLLWRGDVWVELSRSDNA